jgi:hypothetical protein
MFLCPYGSRSTRNKWQRHSKPRAFIIHTNHRWSSNRASLHLLSLPQLIPLCKSVAWTTGAEPSLPPLFDNREPPEITGDVTDITRTQKTAFCQKKGIQSRRYHNKFQNSVRSGKPQFMGPPSTVESAGALSMPLIGVIQLQKIRDIYHELKVRVWRRRSWFHVTLQNTR